MIRPFETQRAVWLPDISDGLGRTVLFGERVVGDGDPERYEPFRDLRYFADTVTGITPELVTTLCGWIPPRPRHDSAMGNSWLTSSYLSTFYNHWQVPNGPLPDCTDDDSLIEAAVAARSLHDGTVHSLLGDGAVAVHALGTRAGGETLAGR